MNLSCCAIELSHNIKTIAVHFCHFLIWLRNRMDIKMSKKSENFSEQVEMMLFKETCVLSVSLSGETSMAVCSSSCR